MTQYWCYDVVTLIASYEWPINLYIDHETNSVEMQSNDGMSSTLLYYQLKWCEFSLQKKVYQLYENGWMRQGYLWKFEFCDVV